MSSASPSSNSPVDPAAPPPRTSTSPLPQSSSIPPSEPDSSPPNPPPPPPPPPEPDSPPPPTTSPSTSATSPPSMASPQPTPVPPPHENAPPPLSPPPPSSPPTTSSPPPPDPPPTSTFPPPPPSASPPNSPPQPSNPPPKTPSNNDPPPPPNNPRPSSSPTPPSPNTPESSPPPPTNRPPGNPPPPTTVPPRTPTTPPVPLQSPPPPHSRPRSVPPSSISMTAPPPSTASSPPSFLPPSLNPPGYPSGDGIGAGGTMAIVLVSSLLFLGTIGVIACCIWKRKKKASGHNGGYFLPTSTASPKSGSSVLNIQTSSPKNGSGSGYSPHKPGGLGNSRPWFTYEELVDATNGFSAQNLLGKGGFGYVYKGSLVDGREVAIKQLQTGGGQGEREFRSEVEIISRVHHRHLVSLVGYCISGERRLLVLDYLPNSTLYFHLHGEGQPVMDWAMRVKIAVGAARGIAYLHEDCHPRIIHRDIKSSNILLDSKFEARVSDFGLAKLAMDVNTHITTRVMGTFGYMAPEYASSGKLTEKSDVYSFGVVLLELITGRKPVDTSQPLGDESLVAWARPLLSGGVERGEFGGLADPRLEGNYVDGEMFRVMEAAAACVRHSAAKRPTMGQVVRALDGMVVASDLTNGMKVGESQVFNSGQQSEEIRLLQRMAFGSQDFSTDVFSRGGGGHHRQHSRNDQDDN